MDTHRPRRRLRPIFLGLGCLPLLLIAAGFIVGSPRYYTAKYSPATATATATATARPMVLPATPVPEVQTEPHTCGVHSLRSVYRAYGLDPDDHLLRFRLGTDKR